MPTGRVSHEQVDVLRSGDAKGRISHEQVDVLRSGAAKGRVSFVQVDVLRAGLTAGRLSHITVDVLIGINVALFYDTLSFTDSVSTDLAVGVDPNITLTKAEAISISDGLATSFQVDPALIYFQFGDSFELTEGEGNTSEYHFWDRVRFEDEALAAETFDRTPADTVSIDDSIEQQLAVAFSWLETLDFGESLVINMEQSISVGDQVSLTDNAVVQLIVVGITVTASDALSFSDSISLLSILGNPLADNFVLSDTLKLIFSDGVSVADSLTLSDYADTLFTSLPSFGDGLDFSDSVTILLTTQITTLVSDTVSFTDTLTVRKAQTDVSYLRRYLNSVVR